MSNTQLEELLAGQPADVQDEILAHQHRRTADRPADRAPDPAPCRPARTRQRLPHDAAPRPQALVGRRGDAGRLTARGGSFRSRRIGPRTARRASISRSSSSSVTLGENAPTAPARCTKQSILSRSAPSCCRRSSHRKETTHEHASSRRRDRDPGHHGPDGAGMTATPTQDAARDVTAWHGLTAERGRRAVRASTRAPDSTPPRSSGAARSTGRTSLRRRRRSRPGGRSCASTAT